MSAPEIKLIAVSNVFSRMMQFKNAGDIEVGHSHPYDHATLVGSGSVRVEVLDENGTVQGSKDFIAPDMIMIAKHKLHRLTALQDNTTCVCIHALRTANQDIISSDFLIEPLIGGGGKIANEVQQRLGQPMARLTN